MSDEICSRCNGDTVVGGFLPAPCPLCRPDNAEPLDAIRADRDRLAAECEALRAGSRQAVSDWLVQEWLDASGQQLIDENRRLTAECEALRRERDEARRIGHRMCNFAHDLVTVAGSGNYGPIVSARAGLADMQDTRDIAKLLADSEERARNSERARDAAIARAEAAEAELVRVREERDAYRRVVDAARAYDQHDRGQRPNGGESHVRWMNRNRELRGLLSDTLDALARIVEEG